MDLSESIKIVRVFIGSPGGLEDERRAAREIVEEINQAHSEHWGCQFKLVGWEDTIPGYQRAQSLINIDLDKCQYFIGVLWNRWGTKPDLDEGGFTSGFEEEFCRARDLNAAGSMKDLALYFKIVDVPEGLEAGPEIKKVKGFRNQCIEEKRIFFKDFLTTSEFRDLVRSKITEIGWRESNIHVLPEPGNSESEQSPQEDSADKTNKEANLLDQKALDFISTMSSRPLQSEQTSAFEVARFRLIASSLRRSGNDEVYLGNHDANLIFRYKKEISFSDLEIRALIDCGIVGFDHQNVPLWGWLAASNDKRGAFDRIKVLAIVGNPEERKNAIRLLQITGEPVPELHRFFDKAAVLSRWFGVNADNQIFDVAAQFLSENGSREDIKILRGITDLSADRKSKIASIEASVISRSSQEEALRFISANNIEKIPEHFVKRIFGSASTLSTETLINCLSVKPDGIRLRAVELLLTRGELDEGSANNLLSDSNHEIRLVAVEALHKLKKLPPPDTVRAILTIKKGGPGSGFLQVAETDSSYHDRYLENRMRDLDFDELKLKVANSGVFNDAELFSYYGKFSKKLSGDIRKNLDDQFSAMFDESVKKIEAYPGMEDDYRTKVFKLWSFFQRQLCTRALSILCDLKDKSDIDLVRKTVDAVEVDVSPELLTFLAKFGDWTDIARIERLGTYLPGKRGLLESSYPTYSDEKAAAIYEIGKNRIADLFTVELSSSIRKSLVKIFPKSVFVNLGNDAIIGELDRKDDEYRIIFSLRCIECLSRERLVSILDQYIERDTQRYYNSIHWLDLGVTFSRKITVAIAQREMARRW